MEKATLRGRFWGVEATFRQVKGVHATAVGYSGGAFESPTYQDVCSDGPATPRPSRSSFDPAQVSYDQLLEIFWSNHDPTTPNQPGAGLRQPIPLGHFLPFARAAGRGLASKERLRQEREVQAAHRDGDRPRGNFLAGRGYHQQVSRKSAASQAATSTRPSDDDPGRCGRTRLNSRPSAPKPICTAGIANRSPLLVADQRRTPSMWKWTRYLLSSSPIPRGRPAGWRTALIFSGRALSSSTVSDNRLPM